MMIDRPVFRMKARVSAEGLDALRAIVLGDAYLKAQFGRQRAGRTKTLNALFAKRLINHDGSINGWVLTDDGRRALVMLTDTTTTLPTEET